MRYFSSFFIAMAIFALLMTACDDETDSGTKIDFLVLTPFEVQVKIDSTYQLVVQALDADGVAIEDVDFTWSTSNATVATVSSSGLVTGAAMGTTEIRAEADEIESNICDVIVLGPPATVVMDQPAQAVTLGGTQSISASVYDSLEQVISVSAMEWTVADEAKITLTPGDPGTLADSWSAEVTGLVRGLTSVTASYGGLQSEPINIYIMDLAFSESFDPTDTTTISDGYFQADAMWQLNHDLDGGPKTGKAVILDESGNSYLRITDPSTAYFTNRQLLVMTYGHTNYDAVLGWPDTTGLLTKRQWRCEFRIKGMDDPALGATSESLVIFTEYYESSDNPHYLVFAPGRNRVSAWLGAGSAPGATIPAWGSMPEIQYDTWFNAVVEVFEGTMRAEVYTGTEPTGVWDYTYTIPGYVTPVEYIPGLWLGAFLTDTLYIDEVKYYTP